MPLLSKPIVPLLVAAPLLLALLAAGTVPAPLPADDCILYVNDPSGPGALFGTCVGTCDKGTCRVVTDTDAAGTITYECKCQTPDGDDDDTDPDLTDPVVDCDAVFQNYGNGLYAWTCRVNKCEGTCPQGEAPGDGESLRACRCVVPAPVQ